jgi:steroid delta-isomerase-like uncharacterized protein
MTTATATDLTNLIREYTNAVWNEHNVDAMDRYYPVDYAHHDVSRPDVTTLEDYRQWGRDLIAAFEGLRVHFDDVMADPEAGKALKRWTVTGKHTGAIAGIAPTGKDVAFSGMSEYRIVDGKIAEAWYIYDLFGLLQELGALPA